MVGMFHISLTGFMDKTEVLAMMCVLLLIAIVVALKRYDGCLLWINIISFL